ncbi:MAG TPA: tRNA-uridine aminocarboxypropyltransferase [Kofleriaceae bacterium]|nr:tRNA-uridine aminocarboxypropyltransferase [Kofleriaceae bacterium]
MVSAVPRVTCRRCRRPASACYCAALPTLETSTRVVILQHPRERDMPIGTARMASLCLPNASLHVGVQWDGDPALRAALDEPGRTPILLYPGAGAKDILREPPRGPVTLVVVDGTWSQAKTVVRDNPILRALPRYAFEAPEKSEYRIRREPRDEYCSTIEALMHVLGALEHDPARFRALLDPLRAMVDMQLAARARSWTPRSRYRGDRAPRSLRDRLPAALFERWDELVIVVGEANAWPYERDPAGGNNRRDSLRDELVHWAAYRPASGQTFSMIAAPRGALSPTATFHTALSEEQLLGGAAREAVLDAFAAWSRPTDVMIVWGHYGAKLWRASGGAPIAAWIDLREVARNLQQGKVGTLEAYAGEIDAALAPGRAGRRLAMIDAIVRRFRALT